MESTASITHFETPDGRYELWCEKKLSFRHVRHYHHNDSMVTLAELKEKGSASSLPASASIVSRIRRSAAQFLRFGRHVRKEYEQIPLSSVNSTGSSSFDVASSSDSASDSNYRGAGTFLVANVGDALFISDLNPENKIPLKVFCFNGEAFPVCHAFDAKATDGHDLVIGMSNGDVYTASLREQLQNAGNELVGAHRHNISGYERSLMLLYYEDPFARHRCPLLCAVLSMGSMIASVFFVLFFDLVSNLSQNL
ncbi:hypothetical protein Droror1_Dr00013910 [Drosera rotundifolia]